MLFPGKENTCAIIVTYEPSDSVCRLLIALQDQLPSVILVDNNSSEGNLSKLSPFTDSSSVELHKNNENIGLGAALNQAVSLAISRGFKWVVMLDQDTSIHEDFFESLIGIYTLSEGEYPLIGCNYRDISKKKNFIEPDNFKKSFIERRTVITSGTLMRLDLFISIGCFRADYFIDSIDHEYCLRARSAGFSVAISTKVLMSHTIGSTESKKCRWLAFDHPPIRKYYMVRNTLGTVREYLIREPLWAIRQIFRLLVEFLSILLFECNKKAKILAFCKGVIDAISNRMGSLD
ncbi:MAG: glycosyltransferase [Cycloclasticus sp.]